MKFVKNKKVEETSRIIESLKEQQKMYMRKDSADDYAAGLYNGLEMSQAILEDREPNLIFITMNPSIYEDEEVAENAGRTVASGRRAKG